jgi:hypothetical protein
LKKSRSKKTGQEPTGASDILNKSFQTAFRSGISGMSAQALNVCTLMWMRTIMNFQHQHGGSVTNVAKTLYGQGGIPRFYQGLVPGLIQAPLARFADTAANDGAFAALEHSHLPTAAKTLIASGVAAGLRVVLMPIDAWKTAKQVEGPDGLKRLLEKTRKHPTALWHGSGAAMAAAFAGHFPWFYTNNQLHESLPQFDFTYGKPVRSALIGFCSATVSDTCSNSFRVLKTIRQTSLPEPVGYVQAARQVIESEGLVGLCGRGLKARILINGIHGAIFTVWWRGVSR